MESLVFRCFGIVEYIYIYIYCHSHTDCFVLSELFSVARHAGRSKPGSKPIQLYVRLSLRPLGQQADHVGQGNFKGIYVATAAASVCLHVYTLSATRVLNSFEELCIMRAAADNSFTRVLNPYTPTHEQDARRDQFLREVQQVLIIGFPSPSPLATLRLKKPCLPNCLSTERIIGSIHFV